MRAEHVLLAGELFDALGWSTEERRGKDFPEAFHVYCQLLNALKPDERDLILLITRRYKWFKSDALPDEFFKAWQLLVSRLASTTTAVAVLPMLKPNSKGPKSSGTMFSYAANLELAMRQEIPGRNLVLCSTQLGLARHLKKHGSLGTALVLLDDYAGTGDTAAKCLAKVRKTFPNLIGAPTYALTLVAHQQAVTALQGLSCEVVCNEVYQKGISQNADVPDIASALQTMSRIEKRLRIAERDRLGYGASEGLLTLLRTPNNTFPVFWADRKTKGVQWPAPFKRIRHY